LLLLFPSYYSNIFHASKVKAAGARARGRPVRGPHLMSARVCARRGAGEERGDGRKRRHSPIPLFKPRERAAARAADAAPARAPEEPAAKRAAPAAKPEQQAGHRRLHRMLVPACLR